MLNVKLVMLIPSLLFGLTEFYSGWPVLGVAGHSGRLVIWPKGHPCKGIIKDSPPPPHTPHVNHLSPLSKLGSWPPTFEETMQLLANIASFYLNPRLSRLILWPTCIVQMIEVLLNDLLCLSGTNPGQFKSKRTWIFTYTWMVYKHWSILLFLFENYSTLYIKTSFFIYPHGFSMIGSKKLNVLHVRTSSYIVSFKNYCSSLPNVNYSDYSFS